jgi:hypothetical protein
MSLKTEVFEMLRQNLISVRPEYGSKDVVLCPICMREIPRQAVQDGGIEHVIPENVVKLDNTNISGLGTQNQRCGITLLCRQARTCKSDDTTSHDGCNGLKGKLYDRLFRNLFDEQGHRPTEFIHRHGVGILVMAYLGAF